MPNGRIRISFVTKSSELSKSQVLIPTSGFSPWHACHYVLVGWMGPRRGGNTFPCPIGVPCCCCCCCWGGGHSVIISLCFVPRVNCKILPFFTPLRFCDLVVSFSHCIVLPLPQGRRGSSSILRCSDRAVHPLFKLRPELPPCETFIGVSTHISYHAPPCNSFLSSSVAHFDLPLPHLPHQGLRFSLKLPVGKCVALTKLKV